MNYVQVALNPPQGRYVIRPITTSGSKSTPTASNLPMSTHAPRVLFLFLFLHTDAQLRQTRFCMSSTAFPRQLILSPCRIDLEKHYPTLNKYRIHGCALSGHRRHSLRGTVQALFYSWSLVIDCHWTWLGEWCVVKHTGQASPDSLADAGHLRYPGIDNRLGGTTFACINNPGQLREQSLGLFVKFNE